MPEWRVWDTETGQPSTKRVAKLPPEAEKSGDGKWAAIRNETDAGVETVVTFVLVETPAEKRRLGYRPSRRLASGTDRTRRRPE